LLQTVVDLAASTGVPHDRVSVGFPGMIRHGVVLATPHYVTEAGPFTKRDPDLEEKWAGFDVRAAMAEAIRAPPRGLHADGVAGPHYVTEAGPFTKRDPDLEKKWAGFDVRAAMEDALRAPTRVLNDAEVAGLAVIQRRGFEVVFTLGTGLGCALFDEGRLLPKIEVSHAPFRHGQPYDQQLGHHARNRIGARRWTGRVVLAIESLRPVLWWDRAYVGGGGAKNLTADLGSDITIITNQHGLLGGVRLWDEPAP